MKRPHRVTTTLTRAERAMLRRARRYVKAMCGKEYDSDAEALRFLARNWSPP